MKKGEHYTLEDYIITDEGKIINKHSNRELKPQPNGKGYLRVGIGHKLYFVHRLVAQKFVLNPQNKLQVNHIDGNKLNNKASNLEWVTNQENREHAIKNDLHAKGERCPYSKLKQKDVEYIRQHTEMFVTDLAQMFNVSRSTINDVIKNRTWK